MKTQDSSLKSQEDRPNGPDKTYKSDRNDGEVER